MKILIVGGGGREHALAWKIAQSPLCEKLYCLPGNPGIESLAESVSLDMGSDFTGLTGWCVDHGIDLVAVGIKAFGPTAQAAQLEASKRFAKDLMREAGIPTAAAASFTGLDAAMAYLDGQSLPIVIKAEGLAEGKGVTVAHTREEAAEALRQCLSERVFGEAGGEVLIEEFMAGEEASLPATAILRSPFGLFHPRTGSALWGAWIGLMIGLTCWSAWTLCKRGIDYRGVVYAGLMITKDGPKVVEFNCRFGDPETQALLPRLENDLVEVMLACAEGRLAEVDLKWSAEAAVCVTAASGGYPGPYEKGKVIKGLEAITPGRAGTPRATSLPTAAVCWA